MTTIDACVLCLRRTWLLSGLSPFLDTVRDRHGRPDELLALSDADLIQGVAGRRAGPVRARYEAFDPAGARNTIVASGLRAVCRHADGYPAVLTGMPAPPAVLFGAGPLLGGGPNGRGLFASCTGDSGESGGTGRGDIAPAVAIVGSRRCSDYGRAVAASLGRALAAAGVPVVSGMALGVDSAAHEGALGAGGPTVAVLGCGADVAYPARKRALHARLRVQGAVVSEMPPGFAARRWSFPVRNRVIAGLAALTVVVEGEERSGSLITARLARELGREVGAVPGPVTLPGAAGPNALLYDGAHLVRDAQDVLDILYGAGARTISPPRDPSTLPPELRAIHAAVAEGAATPTAIAAAGHDVDSALAGIAELEVRGFVHRGSGGGYFVTP